MDTVVEVGRIQRAGGSNAVLIPLQMLRALGWSRGDRVAIRSIGNKLVLERIPLEQIALLRHADGFAHVPQP